MDGVSSANQSPGGASAGTVEEPNTATRSYSLSTDTQPEVAPSQKPEVARRADCPGTLLSTHKFVQVDEFCFHLHLNRPKAPTTDRQHQSILHSIPEPEIEILMTSSKHRQRMSQL